MATGKKLSWNKKQMETKISEMPWRPRQLRGNNKMIRRINELIASWEVASLRHCVSTVPSANTDVMWKSPPTAVHGHEGSYQAKKSTVVTIGRPCWRMIEEHGHKVMNASYVSIYHVAGYTPSNSRLRGLYHTPCANCHTCFPSPSAPCQATMPR